MIDVIRMLKDFLKIILRVERRRCKDVFSCDEEMFWRGTHAPFVNDLSRCEAQIVMHYHVIEKGLTMPDRRLAFGKPIVAQLMSEVELAAEKFQGHSKTIDHAIGVVKAYWELHAKEGYAFPEDKAFWGSVCRFVSRYPDVATARQFSETRTEFYGDLESPFPVFAKSRHTVRHYTDEAIPISVIRDAVELATTTPSACNRHHVRVHCIANRMIARKILQVQGGTRGFGHLADKALIVTSDLSVEMSPDDSFDPYVNGGLFLMNLCYSLHYYRIAHCILTCSIPRDRLQQIKTMAKIPPNEVVVAMLSCGIAPNEFDVAASPKKSADEILSILE